VPASAVQSIGKAQVVLPALYARFSRRDDAIEAARETSAVVGEARAPAGGKAAA
jgi:hypothetical protein